MFNISSTISQSQTRQLFLLLLLAIIFGFVGDWLNLPIAWLLAPMIVGIVFSLVKGDAQSMPRAFSVVGQGIVAVVTASRFSLETLATAWDYVLPLSLCISITASLSLFNGYLIHKFTDIDFNTSFLSSIPGAGMSLVAMSEEIGADAIAVAVLQYLRILIVSLVIPIFATLYFSDSLPEYIIQPTIIEHTDLHPFTNLTNTIVIGAIAFLGVWITRQIKFPSPLFFGPFLSSLILFSFFPQLNHFPSYIFTIGLFLLGLSIGVKFERQIVTKLFKAVIIDIFLVLILIIACLVVGYGFHLITNIDAMTAILGSTPGGFSAMMATIIELGGDSGLVLMMQMTRMLLILTLTPFLGLLLKQQSHPN